MAALEYFDEKTLSSLTFTECSALEFPSTIQRFKNLKALNVYNSAIVGWSEDFALTSSHFPSIQTVRLWYIDLQCSPEGLYRHPLSSSLEWLSLYDIDITGFVDEVGEQWKNLQFAYSDMTRIEDIPQVVTTMPSLLELSLTYNAFTSLNTSRVANLEQLTSLWMDGQVPEVLDRLSCASRRKARTRRLHGLQQCRIDNTQQRTTKLSTMA